MSEKLARAHHTTVTHAQPADPGSTSEIFVGGRHAGLDRTAAPRDPFEPQTPDPRQAQPAADPGSTSELFVGGRHAGLDRTATPRDPFEPQTPDPRQAPPAADPGSTAEIPIVSKHGGIDKTLARTATSTAATPSASSDVASVGTSAAVISVCVMISRILGFGRTWAMAFALGSTLLASSYTVANNLPNMLYELVVGGMLVTAFLPVYVSVKKKLGTQAGNEYASNLLSITILFLGAIALACTVFAPQLIYTQSFMNDQGQMETAIFFFRFFAMQILFYGVSAIVSGLLNASRDYFWSSIAPAFNNVIVIATFVAYALVVPTNPQAALWIIAIGNPLGVFVQMAMQLPALRRNGIRLRLRIDFRDPALRETLSIGVPALLVMATSFVIVSVQNAVAYDIAGNGPSIIAYARLWFTLPYAFLAVPITTAMFTELSEMKAEEAKDDFKAGIVSGTRQILFLTLPFALYLMVFSMPLVTLYHAGAFTEDNVSQVAFYLMALALSLPFYSVNTYLQKIFSALRKMRLFAVINLACAAVQIAFTLAFGTVVMAGTGYALEAVAVGETVFFLLSDVICFACLRKRYGAFGLRSVAVTFLRSLGLGLLGAAVGLLVVSLLATCVHPYEGSIPFSLLYVAAGGLCALGTTFGIAIKLKLPGAAFLTNAVSGIARRLRRSK